MKETTGPAALKHEVPLEKLIRDALNYDTNYYKQALGVDEVNVSREQNGVYKS